MAERPTFLQALPARGLVCALILGLPLLFAACDPCAGVASCQTDPFISLEGQFFDRATRTPAEGVEVEFERTGGAELNGGPVAAISNDEGRFRLRAPASTDGEVVGRVTVRPPAHPAYTIPEIRIQTESTRGDGTILPNRWVVEPYFDFLGELYSSETGRPVGVDTKVTFKWTGGIPLAQETHTVSTDIDGRFILSPDAVGHGEVVGDLIVEGVIGDRYEERQITGVRFATTYVERPLGVNAVWYLGRNLRYVGEIRHRTGYEAAVGVKVHFQRTGGILTEPESFTAETDELGRFPIILRPLADGTLIGTLTFELGEPVGTITLGDVEIPTFDVDGLRLFRVWSFGPSLNYEGQLRGAVTGAPLSALPVRITRIGGIPVRTAVVATTTDISGRFRISPFPLARGEVEVEVAVDLPGPEPDFSTRTTLTTYETDEVREAGVWYVPGL